MGANEMNLKTIFMVLITTIMTSKNFRGRTIDIVLIFREV